MEEYIGCKFGHQWTSVKTFVHAFHHCGKTRDTGVQFPCYALEHSLDTLDKGDEIPTAKTEGREWQLQTNSKAEDSNWETRGPHVELLN